MKRNYFITGIVSLGCAMLGIASFILILIGPADWVNVLIMISLVFFVLAVAAGGYSLLIQKNRQAWTGLIMGLVFIIVYITIGFLLRNMCVVC